MIVLPAPLCLRANALLPQDTIRVKSDPGAPAPSSAGATSSGTTVPPNSPPGPAAGQPSGYDACLQQAPIFLVFGIVMYFFILRPAQKQEKARRELLAKMKRGDQVVTNSGLHGVITNINDQTVQLKVDADVTLTFDRGAIAKVAGDEVAQKADGKKA